MKRAVSTQLAHYSLFDSNIYQWLLVVRYFRPSAGGPAQAAGSSLRLIHRDIKRARCSKQPSVKARQRDRLPTGTQEFDRCQMDGIERSHGDWKWLQGARENRRRQFDQRHMADQGSRCLPCDRPNRLALMRFSFQKLLLSIANLRRTSA